MDTMQETIANLDRGLLYAILSGLGLEITFDGTDQVIVRGADLSHLAAVCNTVHAWNPAALVDLDDDALVVTCG